jgi:ubiquitin-conjugating enzyme E2 O
MSGTVVETHVHCILIPVETKTSRHRDHGGDNPILSPDFKAEEMLVNIPAEEIEPANAYQEGSIVIYHNWVGRIEEVYDNITIRLPNQSVVQVEKAELVNHITKRARRFEVGDTVTTSKQNIRYGIWQHGSYDPKVTISPRVIGEVVKVQPAEAVISWLCRRLHSTSETALHLEPSRSMLISQLEKGHVYVYDRSRTPRGEAADASYGRCIDLQIGATVRFKEPTGAAMKYDGSKLDGGGISHRNFLRRIPKETTLGYDLNVYTILSMRTTATVLWQNCSTTHEDSKQLVPDINVEDESEVWPGEIVLSNENVPLPGQEWIHQPKKVGVVQSVSASDRLATVLWLSEAKIQYHNISDGGDDFMPPALLPGSTLGLTLHPGRNLSHLNLPKNVILEDVTLYDIRAADGLNKRRGDFVILHPPEEIGLNTSTALDWIGEVVDLGQDGFLTVRLGALENVKDVRIAPEYATIVYSTDMTHEQPGALDDEWESGSDTDEEEGVWEAPNGEPVLEDSDAEEWLTESEEGGEDMDHALEEHGSVWDDEDARPSSPMDGIENAQTSRQTREETFFETAPSTPQANTEFSQERPIYTRTETTPPSFAILDTAPPDSNPYLHPPPPALSSALMKRILKEHKILQSSLPDGIFVRTWESRLDLLRVLIVGPLDTPYEFAPFVIDMRLPPDYPRIPPEAYFHSWTQGNGPVNPNLYENGKICLSLLGTWHADEKGENWSPARSTILQVLVSLLGLVLVKEPYYNEAGFEVRAGLADAAVPSALYSERTYFRSRGFIRYILCNKIDGLMDIIGWLYLDPRDSAPRLLDRAFKAGEEVLASGEGGVKRAGLSRISKGALVMLKRELVSIEEEKLALLSTGLPDWVAIE